LSKIVIKLYHFNVYSCDNNELENKKMDIIKYFIKL